LASRTAPTVNHLVLLAVGTAALSACGSAKSPKAPPANRYQIVQVDRVTPDTRDILQIDTATGITWRLVPVSGSYDNIGGHMIADLTIESRSPYYRVRPDLGRSYPAEEYVREAAPENTADQRQPAQEARQ
jgi:hypothetical protein